MKAGGRQRIEITLSAVVPGVYFYRVVAVSQRQTALRTGRMTVLR